METWVEEGGEMDQGEGGYPSYDRGPERTFTPPSVDKQWSQRGYSPSYVERNTSGGEVEETQAAYIPDKPGEMHQVSVGFGQTLLKMSREAWQAAKPGLRSYLRTPLNKVRFTHTGTLQCVNNEECMQACRDIQSYYMDLGFPDIPFNFLIGGDGVLYSARGWNKAADRAPTFQKLRKTCIDVAYIGNFSREPVPYAMLSTGMDFLKLGLKMGRITPFYQAYSFFGERYPGPRKKPLPQAVQIQEDNPLPDNTTELDGPELYG